MNAPSPSAPPLASSTAPTAADNRRGIGAMMLAMGLFVSADSFAKLARESMPAGELMFVRGVFASALAIMLVLWLGEAQRWRLVAQRRIVVRATLELCVAFAFLTALGHLPLADLTAIGQSTPLIIAVACAALGLEPMGWRRWLAVIVGFGGVLLVVRPGGAGFGLYSALAFLSALLVATRDLLTRRIAGHVPTVLILATTAILVMLGGLAMWPLEDWRPVSPLNMLWLAMAGLLVCSANYCMITAFRHVDVSVISPFRYSVILWAGLSGFVVFGERPDGVAAMGAALIVGSGLYTVHRERLRARAERAKAAV